MSDRSDSDFVADMLEAVERISAYIASLDYDDFLSDTKTQDAVIRNLEVIGEAAKNVSTGIRQQHSDIPWQSMAGVRDRLIHDYFGVNIDIVWEIATNELPAVGKSLNRIAGEAIDE